MCDQECTIGLLGDRVLSVCCVGVIGGQCHWIQLFSYLITRQSS